MGDPRTQLQIATDSRFTNVVSNYELAYATRLQFQKDDLPYGKDLYVRVKYQHDIGDSPWSNPVRFKLIIPAQIIGIMLDNTTTKGQFFWINEKGNRLKDPFDYTRHNVFKNISNVIVDQNRSPVSMFKIPKFYIKTMASGPAGSESTGKKCWWISDVPIEGFVPHPAFLRNINGTESDYMLIGKYLGHNENLGGKTTIGSQQGKVVLAGQTKETMSSYIKNRNDATISETGYRMYDIWDHGVLRLLTLIAKRNADTQTTFGDNAVNIGFPVTGSTSARISFEKPVEGEEFSPTVSIEDMWRCYWYYCDCLQINEDKTITLKDPRDQTTNLTFGEMPVLRYTLPSNEGWIRDVLDCPMDIGKYKYDLMSLFLPSLVVTTEAQATFYDYYYINTGDVVFGSSANYTERYIEYGTKNISYFQKFNTGCSRRVLVEATSTSYYAKYGTSCSKRSYINAVPAMSNYAHYGSGSCPDINEGNILTIKSACTSCYIIYCNNAGTAVSYGYGTVTSDSTYYGGKRIGSTTKTSYAACDGSYCKDYYPNSFTSPNCGVFNGSYGTWKARCNYSYDSPSFSAGCLGRGHKLCGDIYIDSSHSLNYLTIYGSYNLNDYIDHKGIAYNLAAVPRTLCRSNGKACSSSNCPQLYQAAVAAYYKCSQSGSTCAESACPHVYSSTSAFYKCTQSGTTCVTTECPYTHSTEQTQTEQSRVQSYESGSHGLFSMGIGVKFPDYNQTTIGCRIAKN